VKFFLPQNKVNFLIAREYIKEAAVGANFSKLSRKEKLIYEKYRTIQNIFEHMRIQTKHYRD
jgi:hypothetical protein